MHKTMTNLYLAICENLLKSCAKHRDLHAKLATLMFIPHFSVHLSARLETSEDHPCIISQEILQCVWVASQRKKLPQKAFPWNDEATNFWERVAPRSVVVNTHKFWHKVPFTETGLRLNDPSTERKSSCHAACVIVDVWRRAGRDEEDAILRGFLLGVALVYLRHPFLNQSISPGEVAMVIQFHNREHLFETVPRKKWLVEICSLWLLLLFSNTTIWEMLFGKTFLSSKATRGLAGKIFWWNFFGFRGLAQEQVVWFFVFVQKLISNLKWNDLWRWPHNYQRIGREAIPVFREVSLPQLFTALCK